MVIPEIPLRSRPGLAMRCGPGRALVSRGRLERFHGVTVSDFTASRWGGKGRLSFAWPGDGFEADGGGRAGMGGIDRLLVEAFLGANFFAAGRDSDP